jgi:tetratricopeptide (TPR) repeat protein
MKGLVASDSAAGGPAGRRDRVLGALAIAAIVIAGLAAYSGSLYGEFVFDDDGSIAGNDLVHDLGYWIGSRTGYDAMPSRWVGNLTFALDYAAHGLEVFGYHAVNLAIHILNALLVYALVRVSFRTPHLRRSALAAWDRAPALVAALLFVAHPVQTQAVSYVVQRFTSLATLFYLLAVVLYARWRMAREAGGARGAAGAAGYAAVLASALLAMKTKEIAFTLPLVVGLYEVAFFEGPWRRRLLWLAPILVTMLVVPLAVLGTQKPIGEALSDLSEVTKVQTSMSRLEYLSTEIAVVVTYLRLLALPVGQNLDYDYPIHRSFLEPRVAASALLLLALAATAAILYGGPLARRRRGSPDSAERLASFGIAWFFVALSVESSFIPIVDVIFEHRVYLPSAGFFVALAVFGALLARRLAPARPAAVTVAAGLLLAGALGAATFARNQVWATQLSLWTDVVSKSPRKSRPHDSLGLALAHLGREKEAIAEFQEAIRLDPESAKARNNLGVALAALGRIEEAKASLAAAIRIAPEHAEARYNLGRIYLLDEGRYAEAAALFEEAIALRREYPDAHANLAAAWNALGRYGDVARLLERERRVVRRQPEAHFNLGCAYVALGDVAAAEREVRALETLSPPLATRLRGILGQAAPGRPPGQ